MRGVPQLKEGQAAPAFRLRDHAGTPSGSDDLRGKRTVLYFFPKADTPG